MTSRAMSGIAVDQGRTGSWAPDRLPPRRQDGSREILSGAIEGALTDLLRNQLGVHGEFESEEEGGDFIDVVSTIDVLANSLTCRVGASAGSRLIQRLYGVDRPAIVGGDNDLNGPIAQRILKGLLALFVDAFREIASSARGDDRLETQASGSGISEARSTEAISVRPCGIRVEYELSSQDLARVLSIYRPRGEEPPDENPEILRAFEGRIDTTLVHLEAILDDREIPLSEIRTWRVGDLLQLKSTPESVVSLAIEGRSMFQCGLARNEGYFALRLIDPSATIPEGDR